jgi:hypothetical protein
MARRRGRSKTGKRNARLIELLISPLWLVLLFMAWRSGASLKTLALASGALATYYLFFVPRSCGALRSNGKSFCQDDGRGFLRGCGRIEHLKWNLRKYFLGGRPSRHRAPTSPRGRGPEEAEGPAGSDRRSFPGSELLAGSESIVAILSLIVTILAWIFPQS